LVNNPVAKSTIGETRWVQNLYLLPEASSPMFTQPLDTSADLAVALLIHYSFDLSGYNASELVNRWQTQYPGNWLHIAVIEALYQGRYKAISVQQILTFWQRRGVAIFHFNMEFERLICSKFPESLTEQAQAALPSIKQSSNLLPPAPAKPAPSNTLPPSEARVSNAYKPSYAAPLQLPKGEEKQSIVEETTEEDKEYLSKQLATAEQRLPVPALSAATSQDTPSVWSALGQRSATSDVNQKVSNPQSQMNKLAKLLPEPPTETELPAVIHPPIEQFTPISSDRSESFTSKLKAISGEKNA
jgi:hypothetical protein